MHSCSASSNCDGPTLEITVCPSNMIKVSCVHTVQYCSDTWKNTPVVMQHSETGKFHWIKKEPILKGHLPSDVPKVTSHVLGEAISRYQVGKARGRTGGYRRHSLVRCSRDGMSLCLPCGGKPAIYGKMTLRSVSSFVIPLFVPSGESTWGYVAFPNFWWIYNYFIKSLAFWDTLQNNSCRWLPKGFVLLSYCVMVLYICLHQEKFP
jgi:hypothetical protein